jgi:hypothetical protein
MYVFVRERGGERDIPDLLVRELVDQREVSLVGRDSEQRARA